MMERATCSFRPVPPFFRELPRGRGRTVSYRETGSQGLFPIRVQRGHFSRCPRRKIVLLPCVSEDRVRVLYTSGTRENRKQDMPMTTEDESTQERHGGGCLGPRKLV